MAYSKLFGITVAMLTAFDERGEINPEAEKELADFLVEKGADCLYPLGTTGEMWRMSVAERKQMAEAVVENIKGRVPVYIHIGTNSTSDTVELARHAESIRSDGIAAVTPSYGHLEDREIEEYYAAIATAVSSNYPVYMYSIPQCSTNDVSFDTARNLMKRFPNIVGIKYSLSDMARTQQYKEIGLSVIHGADTLLLELLAMGLPGTVSGASSVYPEPFVALLNQWNKGELEACRWLETVCRSYVKAIHAGGNLEYSKEALRYRGVVDLGHVRAPGLPLKQNEIDQMADELKELDARYLAECISLCKK